MRICSLIPSATEICFALGLSDELVGRTHECDFPPEAAEKPQVTRSEIAQSLPGAEIDRLVRRELAGSGTLYRLDAEQLERLAPDLLLTQELCTVCAVSFQNVLRIAHGLSSKPRVVSLEPTSLDGIFASIREVGRLAGVSGRADRLVASMEARLDRLRRAVEGRPRKNVLCLEWIDPPFCAGHWIPELVEIAGGHDAMGRKHAPSRAVAWNQIIEYNPDIIIVMCCGFSVERTMEEIFSSGHPFLRQMRASTGPRVVVADGSAYFSRPGPRIVESAEILASIIHPESVPRSSGWTDLQHLDQ